MVKASKGIRSKTRHTLKKKAREKGLTPITRFFQEFSIGEKASIIIDPGIQRGHPHPRFHGQTGTIIGKQGDAFLVEINEKGKLKTVIAMPEHLRKLG